ncbi:unnamed protein product [Linum trigynum]|uniref:DUF4283 domain-containing protein n=1 Tax=Linum trigynum TaxID=586398 RepID=A0AAV2EAS9_9ROSI
MSAAGPNTKLSPAPKPPDALTGSRRPPTTTSSPNGKGDREAQHQKKKAKAVGEDGTTDSDSEEVAEAEREEDDYASEGEYDPTCPTVLFSAAEKRSFRRDWRSALVVRGLGRNVPFNLLSPRLHQLWAKHGGLQISDMQNGCYLIRFRKKEDYEAAISGGPWTLGDTYLPVHRWYRGFDPWTAVTKSTMIWATDPCMPMQKSTRDHF